MRPLEHSYITRLRYCFCKFRRCLEATEDGQVKLKSKNGKKSQEWTINSDGTIENSEFNLVLTTNGTKQPLICAQKGKNDQKFLIEVFKKEEYEYNKLICSSCFAKN